MYSLRGKSYESAGAIAEAFGVSLKKFNWRIENGWALEEALELIQRKKPQAKIAVSGDKIFYSQREMALHFNISEGTLNKRIRSGWSIEQALGFENPPNSKQMIKPVSVNGKTFRSQAAFARYLKVHYSTMTQLLKTKSPEEIIEIYSS